MTKTKTLHINLQRTLPRKGVALMTVDKLNRYGVGVDDFRARLEDDFSTYWPAVNDEFYALRKELAVDLFVDKLMQYAGYGIATYATPAWVGRDSRIVLKEYGRNIINHPHGVQP